MADVTRNCVCRRRAWRESLNRAVAEGQRDRDRFEFITKISGVEKGAKGGDVAAGKGDRQGLFCACAQKVTREIDVGGAKAL
jgi:hypothetical protein